MSLTRSRSSTMLMVSWFSTSTLPLRSNSSPRGAGSGTRCMYWLSAMSLNCCVLRDLEDPEARPPAPTNASASTYCITLSRSVQTPSIVRTGMVGT